MRRIGVALFVFLLPGCTFYLVRGGGPVPVTEVPNRTPAQRVTKAVAAAGGGEYSNRNPFSSIEVRSAYDVPGRVWWRFKSALIPGRHARLSSVGSALTVVRHASPGFLVGGIIWRQSGHATYGGAPLLLRSRSCGGSFLSPLIIYDEMVSPAMDARYRDYRWAHLVAAGLLGWGRVNHRAYLQVAWIPIPLWRIGLKQQAELGAAQVQGGAEGSGVY